MSMVKIEEVAEIFSGQIMSRITQADGKDGDNTYLFKIIVPKAISSEGLILESEIQNEQVKIIPDERRITKLGDIVIKLSTPFDSATITEKFVGCLVPSFCAIIRHSEKIDNDYLQAFLNSRFCKEQLKAKVAGAVMTILSIGKIGDVNIPLPGLEKQREIGTNYRLVQKRIAIVKEIIDLETKRNDILINDLVKYE